MRLRDSLAGVLIKEKVRPKVILGRFEVALIYAQLPKS